tara:strand:- start:139 stop:1344 length:1206 start_codon:yes stop_codon:yes gene_type:complete
MAAPEFKAKPKGIKGNIVRAVFNKFRPKPKPKPTSDYKVLSPKERAKVLKDQKEKMDALKQGAPPLRRRPAGYAKNMRDENIRGTGSAYTSPTPTPTPAPVTRPRTEPISIDRFDKMLPPKEFVARQRAAYGNKVPSWQVLKKEAEGYGFVVPDSPKDVVEHNRLMNRNLQYRKYKRQEIQKILSGDPERVKAEILDMKRKGVDVDIESPMPKHLAASIKTDELGRMVPDRPPIRHSPEKNARLLFEARRKAAAEAAEKRLAAQPDNLIQDLAETVASQQPPEPASLRMGGDPFAEAEAQIKFGRNIPQVKRQGTGGASSKATPIIQRPVGQPKKMSKTKKALIGATIASPAAIVGSAYLDDDEDSESPDLPKGFTQDDYEKYLKAAEEAAAQARKAAAGQ